MRSLARLFPVLLASCSGGSASPGLDAGTPGADAEAERDAASDVDADVPEDACETSLDDATLRLAVGASVPAATEATLCLRWTAPEDIEVSGFVGTLGLSGHHALLLTQQEPAEPDGVGPCYEPDLMDAQVHGDFGLIAGISYESSGERVEFPSVPVQIGLRIPAGTQLVFDAHFINTTDEPIEPCTTIELDRGANVVAPLQFRTVLPVEEYGLIVPAGGEQDVDYLDDARGAFRIAAASSHMHAGGTYFRMSIAETDETLFETTLWADPQPEVFDVRRVVVEDGQHFRLQCSFQNLGPTDQAFPEQMCVGGMYLLPCTFPGAC